ncbi:alpha/beta fold hydrolase [Sediminibacillus massiliensis]|uniref:alpha/beta fold hydrolase n=1 Tax=Sediminibacillus massiliensis TaxID=1926277 RepID=UPI001FE38FE0|nr:alpha/beta hydrolase [Sediminibacillus massiliensis]
MGKSIEIDGQKVYVEMVGDGEAIVFLHGGPGSEHGFFLPYVLPLSKKYKLILYDQRGCGKSEPRTDNDYSMEDEVNTLESLRSELKLEKMNLFGESWGSILALLYATTYPEKVHKLFLTAAIGVSAEGYRTFEKQLMKRMSIKDKFELFKVSRKIQKGRASGEELLKILDPYYVYSKTTLHKKKNTRMNHTVNQIIGQDIKDNYDITSQVHKLAEIPVKVVQGSHDIMPPNKVDDLLIKYIPHAELHTIKNCGHWTVVEQTSETISIADSFFETT